MENNTQSKNDYSFKSITENEEDIIFLESMESESLYDLKNSRKKIHLTEENDVKIP